MRGRWENWALGLVHNRGIYVCINYGTSARDIDPKAVGPRALVPINCNIPSESCHNRFIFCCEVVYEVSPGSPGSNVSFYQFSLHRFFPRFMTSSCHCYRNPHKSVSQCLVGACVVSFCNQSSSSVGQSGTQLQNGCSCVPNKPQLPIANASSHCSHLARWFTTSSTGHHNHSNHLSMVYNTHAKEMQLARASITQGVHNASIMAWYRMTHLCG